MESHLSGVVTIPWEDDLDRELNRYQQNAPESIAYLRDAIDEDFCHGSDARNWLMCYSKYKFDLECFLTSFDRYIRSAP